MPKIMNKISHNLELWESLALLTIAIVIKQRIKIMLKKTIEPMLAYFKASPLSGMIPVRPKTPTAITRIQIMAAIQLKILAML